MKIGLVGAGLILLLSTAGFLCSAPCPVAAATSEAEFAKQRQAMVAIQLKGRDIFDPATLEAMETVPRHHFVPPDQQRYAYEDRPLPIGYGQTISQPYIVAFMTQMIRPRPGQKILEIGTGSGYQAAVLEACGARVYSIEIVGPLATSARGRLTALGYDTVQTRQADGYHGWADEAPFDAILVTAAAEYMPPPLIEQLKDGGRMIIPVGSPFLVQNLMMVDKRDGEVRTRSLMAVRFVPFRRSE